MTTTHDMQTGARLALVAYAKKSGDFDNGNLDTDPGVVITDLIGNLLELATSLQSTTGGKLDRAQAITHDALHAYEDALSCRVSLIDQLEREVVG